MFSRTRNIAPVLVLLSLALGACSTQTVSPTSSGSVSTPPPATSPALASPVPATPTGAAVGNEGGGGETGAGVESSLTTYSDSTQGFAVGHPGSWTQDPSITKGVRFVGGDDSMTLAFVTPPAGQDAMTYAKNDVAAVSAAFPGFKQLSLAASAEVQNAIILGFEANGTSKVTGKAFTAHDERYYMPLADGRIAILTVAGPTAHYDQQGVRDIALTFKVTK